jgi:hypothetical protein
MRRPMPVILLAVSVGAFAAEGGPAPALTPTKAKPDAARVAASPTSKLDEEQKWIFEPAPGRPDIFVDIQARLLAERKLETIQEKQQDSGYTQQAVPTAEQALEWVKREIQRIESFIVNHKWDDAIKACDNGIKVLQRFGENTAIEKEIQRLKGYRFQAEEAKIAEEARARFDALDLRIEGILWSPDKSLAVINGEPRAKGVNERVKDCVIISIDTNRVEFRFIYNRRPFDFSSYVGEAAKPAAATKAKAR